jgi:hypothetical protein
VPDASDPQKTAKSLKTDPRALEAIAKFEARKNAQRVSAKVSTPKTGGAGKPQGTSPFQNSALAWKPSFAALTQHIDAAPAKLKPFQCPLAAGFAAAFVWLFLHHPLSGILLGTFYLAYAAAIWWRPPLVLVLIPSLLAVLDLSPWSGWWNITEFDGVIWLTFAVLLVRAPLRRADFAFPKRLWISLLLLTLSYIISASLVLLPWPGDAANSIDSYATPFNALYVAKGYFYVLLLLPWCRQFLNAGLRPLLLATAGIVLAAIAVAIYILFERWFLVGLANLNSFYRSIGPFYTVHTGDGHIDVWFSLTTPIVLATALLRPRLIFGAATALLMLVLMYGIVTTGSRGPLLAAIAGCVIAAAVYVLSMRKLGWQVWSGVALVVVLLALLPQLATTFSRTTYLGKRFSTLAVDAKHREEHWADALSLREDSLPTKLFGAGLGQFPSLYAARADARGKPVARFEFAQESGNHFLRLSPGDPVYLQQLIRVEPKTKYLLSYDVRVRTADTYVAMPICQKWILILTHTVDCKKNDYLVKNADAMWSNVRMNANSDNLGQPHWRLGKLGAQPVWLMINTHTSKEPVEIDNIRLVAPDGRNLIRNGDFEQKRDHWFWLTYNHETHHTKNLAVNTLIDQGWFGLLAFLIAFITCLTSLVRRVQAGDMLAATWIGGLAGLLIIAITVSIFDAPRLTMLVYLLIFLPLVSHTRSVATRG